MNKAMKEEFLQGLTLKELIALAREVHIQDIDFDEVEKQDLIKRLRWFSCKLLKKRSKRLKLNKK